MHSRVLFGPQAPSFYLMISTFLGGLFTNFIDSLSCVWLWHRERWMGWTLASESFYFRVRGLVLFCVNSKFKILLPHTFEAHSI